MSEGGVPRPGPADAGPEAPSALFGRGHRLKAVWRLLAWALVFTVAALVALGLLAPAVSLLGRALDVPLEPFWWAMVAALLGTHLVMVRFVDGAGWDEVWLGREAAGVSHWIFGLGLGAVAIGLPSLLLLGVGWLRVVPAPAGSWPVAALHASLLLLPAALAEELFFRGYPLRVLGDALGWVPALLLTSVVFGLVHLENPGAEWRSVALVMLAGVFLGAVLLATRSLYAAWMAHFAWNWTMAALLHAAVSGTGVETPGYRVVDAGPDWATGGVWGPEGGAAAGVAMLLSVGWLLRRRGTLGRLTSEPDDPVDLGRAATRREESSA